MVTKKESDWKNCEIIIYPLYSGSKSEGAVI